MHYNVPIFSVECHEPEGPIKRTVYPMALNPQNIKTFWNKARGFKHLFGRELRDNFHEFASTLVSGENEDDLKANGLFWRIDDFVGIFYMTDIEPNVDAKVHYTFFDRRHRGRIDLVKTMIRYVFMKYGFHRLTAEIPLFATKIYSVDEPSINQGVLSFVQNVGFKPEGRKREAVKFDNDWFDVQHFGILKQETDKWVLNTKLSEELELGLDKTSHTSYKMV
jgi:RimJ/RimL family protein N-acetyltransferase